MEEHEKEENGKAGRLDGEEIRVDKNRREEQQEEE
jgi:hypothetical protein